MQENQADSGRITAILGESRRFWENQGNSGRIESILGKSRDFKLDLTRFKLGAKRFSQNHPKASLPGKKSLRTVKKQACLE
jgi:hypothetical protein